MAATRGSTGSASSSATRSRRRVTTLARLRCELDERQRVRRLQHDRAAGPHLEGLAVEDHAGPLAFDADLVGGLDMHSAELGSPELAGDPGEEAAQNRAGPALDRDELQSPVLVAGKAAR